MKVSNEEIDLMPVGQCSDPVEVVEHAQDIERAVEEMRQHPVLGFDTETRPSFTRGTSYNVALLQFSAPGKTWLFRLCKTGLTQPLADFMADKSITKAGLAIRDDIRGLRRLRIFEPAGFVDVQSVASQMGVEDLSLKKMAAHVLGMRVSKRQRLTNWENASLTPGQIAYAATDSWISLLLYQALQSGATESPRLAEIRATLASQSPTGTAAAARGAQNDTQNQEQKKEEQAQ